MKIELRRIQHFERMSEETNCYAADLYVDGVKVGEVGNDGHGGCDEQRVYPYARLKEINDWCIANLPPISMAEFGMADIPCDLEQHCAKLLEDFLAEKRIKRDLKAKAIFTVPGEKGLYQLPFKQKGRVYPNQVIFDHIEKKHPGAVILNRLPIDQARAAFRAAE
jgi:hypothetical protein